MRQKIMIVGEVFDEQDAKAGKPFSGSSGYLLDGLLAQAGLAKSDCYFTCVFHKRPPGGRLEGFGGPQSEALPGWPRLATKLYVHRSHAPELERLAREIELVKPNLIIALGATPLWALTKRLGIKKHRGCPVLTHDAAYKVLPTYHPSMIMRQWTLRPIVIMDLEKAVAEAEFSQLRRPQRFIHLEPTIDDLWSFHAKYIEPAAAISCDIETKQLSITEVGFAPTKDRALVIPFYARNKPGGNYWDTPEEEYEAWEFVRKVCAEKPLIGQNFSYDIQYLWRTQNIPCPVVADDTMILHHAMYPEMEKSLGFLGSVYTNEPSWKFMRANAETLKTEDD